jgi:hypothetical protein
MEEKSVFPENNILERQGAHAAQQKTASDGHRKS